MSLLLTCKTAVLSALGLSFVTSATLAAEPALRVALSLAQAVANQAPAWQTALRRASVMVTVVPAEPTAQNLEGMDVLLAVGTRKETLSHGHAVVAVNDFAAGSASLEKLGAIAESAEDKAWAGMVPLFFTPLGRAHPISAGISNFQVNSAFPWPLKMHPDAAVLASTWAPDQRKMKNGEPQPYVYAVSPLLWTLEKDQQRTVGLALRGTDMLKNPALKVLVLRSLAWASKRKKLDTFCSDAELQAQLYPPDGPLAPEQALAAMVVHPDFTETLVAAEPLISKVINLDWDEKDRLWVAESLEYPEGRQGGGAEAMPALWRRDSDLKKPAPATRPSRDTISWLEDRDGDGRMDAKQVFADDLDMVTSFCFYKNGVIVAQPPQVLFLQDTKGTGRADQREVLYNGLGTVDAHAVLNNLRWGLDGWIYATHGYSNSRNVVSGNSPKQFGPVNSGVVRFRPDGSAFEMVSAKSGNCWGVDITSEGELFFTQPTSGDLLMHVPTTDRLMAEGGLGREPSWNALIHLRPVRPLMSQADIEEIQCNDVTGSFTAACGCAIYEGGSWPAAWKGGYFTCEPTVNITHHEVITPAGVSYTANKNREEEFTATTDRWHRPIDTRIGPDGNLYVIDFYNQAILHNDPRGPIHLWNNQAARPDRDHFFARIFRLQHKQATPLPAVNLETLTGRVAALGHPNRAARFRAQRLLEENPEQLAEAAKTLINAAGQARIHALWLRAAAGLLTDAEIAPAVLGADDAVRFALGRVLAEHPALVTPNVVAAITAQLSRPGVKTDARANLQLLAAVPPALPLSAALLVKLSAAEDAWTRAAVLRNALGQPVAVWQAAFASDLKMEALLPLLDVLLAKNRQNAVVLAEFIGNLTTPRPALAAAVLQSLGQEPFVSDPAVRARLNELLASTNPTVFIAALPLVAREWTEAERNERLPQAAERALAFANAPDTAAADRQAALVALARLPQFPPSIQAALQQSLGNAAVLAALTSSISPDATRLLLANIKDMAPQPKAQAVESLLSRKASQLALLGALEAGKLTLALAGPAVLARSLDHPDAAVREKAAQVAKLLRGATEARDAVIQRLLPVVSQPGNVETGKTLFAACAVCHQFHGQGNAIGPVLDGIGIHSAEVLLTHIVDPNREVEPSFLAWTVTKKSGESLVGVISRETTPSLFLKNASGEVEVPRESMASQVNSGISLMPVGFESMGAEPLRDIISYLQSGPQRFHALAFNKAATADGSRGVYLAQNLPTDQVSIKKYGVTQVHGVPFSLPDPGTQASGKNVIVLKGGMEAKSVGKTMPTQVEVPVQQPAGRLHLLGAVAGWGWPVMAEQAVLVEMTVHYASGETERLTFRNGVDFSDHIRRIDVPGSAFTDLVHRGQMRYLWRDLPHPGKMVASLTLTSFDRAAAPMIAALTMESPTAEGKLAPPPPVGGPVVVVGTTQALPAAPVPGKLRVLLAGGGNSHDFAKWFDQADQKILTDMGRCITLYNSDPQAALDQLPHADVLLLSANAKLYQENPGFRPALDTFASRGGGLVLLHPATWHNWAAWPAYNQQYVGGGATSHDAYGEFGITMLKPQHPVLAGLPNPLVLKDELYHVKLNPAANVEVEILAETTPAKSGEKHPSIWISPHPHARILCIAPGHDGAAHDNPHFQRLLKNAVLWAGKAE